MNRYCQKLISLFLKVIVNYFFYFTRLQLKIKFEVNFALYQGDNEHVLNDRA